MQEYFSVASSKLHSKCNSFCNSFSGIVWICIAYAIILASINVCFLIIDDSKTEIKHSNHVQDTKFENILSNNHIFRKHHNIDLMQLNLVHTSYDNDNMDNNTSNNTSNITSNNDTTINNTSLKKLIETIKENKTTSIKQWKYIFFQHLRKNGGTMICYHLYRLRLASRKCMRELPKPILISMNTTQYIDAINYMKNELDQLNIRARQNECSTFPLTQNMSVTDKIFQTLWNDTLTITNFREPLFHDLSEVIHGRFPLYDIRVDDDIEWSERVFRGKNGRCYKEFDIQNTSSTLSSVKTSRKIVHCLKNNIHLTYNSYMQVFSNQISWKCFPNRFKFDETNHTDLQAIMNDDGLQNVKQIISAFDVILIQESFNTTFAQLVPFNLIPKCSELWYDAFNHDNNNTTSNSTKSDKLNKFHQCYADFFVEQIWNIEPHAYIKKNFNYDTLTEDARNFIANYTKWDVKVYDFAKDLALKRAKKIFAGEMW